MRGLTAAAAIEALVELSGPADATALPVTEAPRSFAAVLRGRGVDARQVRVETAEDVARLRVPAAVRLEDGSWLVLHRRSKALCDDGEVRLSRALLGSVCVTDAVECFSAPQPTKSGIHHSLESARAHTASLLVVVAVAVLARMLLAVIPEIIRILTDRALPDGAPSLVTAVAVALVIMATTHAVLVRHRGRVLLQVRGAIDTAAGRLFMRHLLNQPFAFFSGMTRGEAMQSVGGLQSARDLLADRVIPAAIDAIPLLVVVALLASESPPLAGAAVVAAIVGAAIRLFCAARQTSLQRREIAVQARHRGLFLEALGGIASIKAVGADRHFCRVWEQLHAREVALSLRRRRVGAVADVASEALRQGGTGFILIAGLLQVMAGRMTIGSLFASVQLGTMLLVSAGALATAAGETLQLSSQLIQSNRVLRSGSVPPPTGTVSSEASVVVDNVWFRYSDVSPWALKSCSLVVNPRDIRRLDWPSGGGKTTLLRLIAGVLSPERGSINIDAVDASRACGVAYLPQFPQMFAGTILENLRIFSGDATEERIRTTAAETGLDRWVASLPMRYETVLAAGGANISGGQRQLLALTAILASDSPLLLLDEPMANLDAESANRVWSCVLEAAKTVIYAEHETVRQRTSRIFSVEQR